MAQDLALTAYSIRPFGEADRASLRDMSNGLQAAERLMEADRAIWPEDAAGYVDDILAEVAARNGRIFLAEAAGAAIGYVSCWHGYEDDRMVDESARNYLYVSDLYVVDAWRGRGVAGALLAAAEAHGRALSLNQMRIGVLAANHGARRAYAKAGFQEYDMILRKKL